MGSKIIADGDCRHEIRRHLLLERKAMANSVLRGSDGKESTCNSGDLGSIPGSGRSPGEGNNNPLQYTSLENPMDKRSLKATAHRVTTELDMTEAT